MAGFMPAIHVLPRPPRVKSWMAGTSPAKTPYYFRFGFSMPMMPSISGSAT